MEGSAFGHVPAQVRGFLDAAVGFAGSPGWPEAVLPPQFPPPPTAALSQGLGQPLGVKRLGILPCSCVILHNVLLLALTLPSPSIQPPLVCSFPTAGA